MEMSNRQVVPAPPAEVWAALNDPNVLQACVPGCESIEKSADNEYVVAMTARVGPVSAKFKGKMRLIDLNPPTSYTLRPSRPWVPGLVKRLATNTNSTTATTTPSSAVTTAAVLRLAGTGFR